MKLENIVLVGVGLLVLSKLARGSASPAAQSDTTTQDTTTNEDYAIPAEQLPEGVLVHGEDAIMASAVPFQLRLNALHNLKDEYNKLMKNITPIWQQYKDLETKMAYIRRDSTDPVKYSAPYAAKRDVLKAKYEMLSGPIIAWYVAEKKNIYATYKV